MNQLAPDAPFIVQSGTKNLIVLQLNFLVIVLINLSLVFKMNITKH